MNLRSLDLNLLLVFDAVYSERSISRAANKLNLSQPAVSNALARLRKRLEDPLFERNAQGMSPTPRAKLLKEPIQQALDLLERGLRGDDTFEFASSDREFVIAVEDYGETVVLPRFVDWLANAAPRVRITIRPEPSALLKEALREGSVDLALDYFGLPDPGFNNKCVLTETLVSLSRQDHPEIGERLSLESYLAQRHVVIAPRTRAMPMIDLALSKRGLKRNISLTVPHFLSMPAVVQSSNMVCTLPRRMAYLYADHFRLRVHAVPVHTPEFPVYLIWHDSFDADPGHQWLRNHLIGLCQSL
jgi:DNA-binding transcriptional LysR family regulator